MSASASIASLFPLITYPQSQHYHEITDPFARRRPSILPVLNDFRTLSIAIGGGTPFRQVPSREKYRANSTSRRTTGEICRARPEYDERERFSVQGVCVLLW